MLYIDTITAFRLSLPLAVATELRILLCCALRSHLRFHNGAVRRCQIPGASPKVSACKICASNFISEADCFPLIAQWWKFRLQFQSEYVGNQRCWLPCLSALCGIFVMLLCTLMVWRFCQHRFGVNCSICMVYVLEKSRSSADAHKPTRRV